MGNLNEFFRDLGRNAYGLGENVASLGSAAIAEPVAGFAAMYDPAYGAQAIREGMTYTPRTQAGQMYRQGAAKTLGAMVQPAMPVIDAWQRGVDVAGGYSPVAGAMLQTVPTALGALMGYKPAMQQGRQVSNSLGAMQSRMIANANAPRTLNAAGFRGQRGAIGTLSTDDDLRALARFNQMDDVYKFDNSHEYYDPIDKLVARNLSDDSFDFMELPTSYGKMSITPSAKEQGKWQVTQWAKDGNPLSDSGNLTKEKALRVFFEDSRPELLSPPKRPLTEFEQAHQLAQRNAALPVNQGGLGLAPDNTAMDRARAMGFDVDNPVYHGTGADIEAFDPKLFKETSQYMKGVFTTDKPDIASNYGDTVYPLVQKQGYTLKDKRTDRASGKTPKEVDTIRDKDKNIIVTTKPENIRSRFAAFDPFNRESSNLLAQYGAIAPTATLGAMMANEKRKEKRN